MNTYITAFTDRLEKAGPNGKPLFDGYMNLVGALRKAMATTGYSDLKEFQRVEMVITG